MKGEKVMSGINELKSKMASDQDFLNMLVNAGDLAYEKAKEAGFEVSKEEWNTLCDQISGDSDGELSLDDLDNVAGGVGAFEGIPRVPINKIDDVLRGKI